MTETDLTDPVSLSRALVKCPSVTPHEGGALALLEDVLKAEGFRVWRMTFSDHDTPDVENLFATIGSGSPHLVFGGHTDVVPAGDEAAWTFPPFSATEKDGVIFGRGIEDMKGGVAAFASAAIRHIRQNGIPGEGAISLLITGDEEGPSVNGTVKLLNWAKEQGFRFDAALVGEPTNVEKLGDVIKVGRRGSLSGTVTISGKQGHVAYPHRALNPTALLPAVISAFALKPLDDGSGPFAPSNLEFVTVDTGNPAWNVIPRTVSASFNIRYNNLWTRQTLESELAERLSSVSAQGYTLGLEFKPGTNDAFLTENSELTGLISAVIREHTGLTPDLTTSGGTSDARFFREYCPVAEFGLVGRSMHQIDEHAPVAEIESLSRIYHGIISHWFAGAAHSHG